ncbi:MAG: nucleotidyltransferase family protein [Oscillospiraceae bacterium]|nr:nucleotidyltransferase family protein [Oscillospiraceae bacterium]
MKTYGIICEYNPFHNGHIYQIEETRKHGADHIVAIMSGNYVQRGDVAIIDKFKRAQIAVNNGADLVIEMPVAYSLASAEMFARAGVMMLAALGCVDGISFGSECGDIELLKNAAMASFSAAAPEKLKPLLEKGMSYPEAVQQIVASEHGPIIASVFDSPNNTLAVEYLRAMKVLKVDLDAFTVKRTGVGHDSMETADKYASGTKLREMIENGDDISPFVPEDMAAAIAEYDDADHLAYFDNLERELLYILRTATPKFVSEVPDIAQGLENRIVQMGKSANSVEEFLRMADTRRYTQAKFRRALLNMYLGIKKVDLQIPPAFGRILAFNERGTEIIKAANENSEAAAERIKLAAENPDAPKNEADKFLIPFSTSIKDLLDKFKVSQVARQAELTCRSSDVYMLASRDVRPSASDFTAKIEMQK